MPAAREKFRPIPRSADLRAGDAMPAPDARSAGPAEIRADDREAALLREFLRCESVSALARSLAARIADGTSAEDFIAAAEGGAGARR
jgi:hypothetical protein